MLLKTLIKLKRVCEIRAGSNLSRREDLRGCRVAGLVLLYTSSENVNTIKLSSATLFCKVSVESSLLLYLHVGLDDSKQLGCHLEDCR